MQELCTQLEESENSIRDLDAASWLERMKELEKGGVRFMDSNKSDVRTRRWGAILSAVSGILFMAVMIILVLEGNRTDPIPKGVLAILILIPAGIIAGIVLALFQRIKELKGGELDEARKY